MKRTTSLGRAGVVVAALAAGAFLLTGCAAAAAPAAPATGSATSAPSRGQSGAGRGISGQIAAVANGTLQVQGGSTQTAVTYTDATKVTQAVGASASAVTVGECVTGITPPGSAAASSVQITPAVNGACAARGGFGGGFGGGAGGTRATRAPGATGTRPSGGFGGGAGRTRPSGAPGGGAFTRPVSGLVTAVTSTDVTVSTTAQGGSASTGTIALDGSTKFTVTRPATAAALVVNECIFASGTADSSGGFAATSIAVTDPGANGCGLGGRPGAANG
ncbi:hypothetical protein [Leifsonia sp. NPDC058230]|uniref:hypothetical protein n=1 Tax=Leifsonia sp. NPDC058230 TaxID=3346391 RepID=UPI0036D90C5C